MEEHLTEALSLKELAGEVQLICRFREAEGTTPWEYFLEKWIDETRELFEHGVPPGEVAAKPGFYDQSHLNKVFKNDTGQTPKEYQEINFGNRN